MSNILPDGLPPLPPVPEGYDRWEARGWSWASSSREPTALAYVGYAEWTVGQHKNGTVGLGDVFYLEAVVDKPTPTGIEALVCQEIAKRQALGLKKYGTTVAENPLVLKEWLQHALEETLDQAIYLRRAIAEIDAKETQK